MNDFNQEEKNRIKRRCNISWMRFLFVFDFKYDDTTPDWIRITFDKESKILSIRKCGGKYGLSWYKSPPPEECNNDFEELLRGIETWCGDRIREFCYKKFLERKCPNINWRLIGSIIELIIILGIIIHYIFGFYWLNILIGEIIIGIVLLFLKSTIKWILHD